MKKVAVYILPFLFILASCQLKNEKKTQENSVKLNSVSVLIEDKLWNTAIGDSIRKKFAAPVVGLPQEEPIFTINQYSLRLLDEFKKQSRNIIVIKKESENKFEIESNLILTPQNIISISGKSIADIIDIIEQKSSEMIQRIKQTEILEIQKNNRKAATTSKKVNKKFGIEVPFPKGYKLVVQKRKFLWLKKEINGGSTSIIFYQVPLLTVLKKNNQVKNILRMRDSIGNLFIHGSRKGTKMTTENSYTPFFTKTTIQNNEAYETKGGWQMANNFMSGPFINYCIIDKPKNRFIVVEGFCYAPSKDKRDLMLELEALIKSVRIIKN